MTGQAVPTVQIDNERTRVTEWRFAPGASTGYHRHEYDYVIVPGDDRGPEDHRAGRRREPRRACRRGELFSGSWCRARRDQCDRWRIRVRRGRAQIATLRDSGGTTTELAVPVDAALAGGRAFQRAAPRCRPHCRPHWAPICWRWTCGTICVCRIARFAGQTLVAGTYTSTPEAPEGPGGIAARVATSPAARQDPSLAHRSPDRGCRHRDRLSGGRRHGVRS